MGVTVTAFGSDLTGADILQQADVSLYKAKNNGRNRTEVFSGVTGHSSGV
jgi:PleD family two-component response regulator